jgi:hypothetical protein
MDSIAIPDFVDGDIPIFTSEELDCIQYQLDSGYDLKHLHGKVFKFGSEFYVIVYGNKNNYMLIL